MVTRWQYIYRLSEKAQEEAKRLILSVNNILVTCKWYANLFLLKIWFLACTTLQKFVLVYVVKELHFLRVHEVVYALPAWQLHYMPKLGCAFNESDYQTTVGRVLLYEALPEGSEFYWVNKIMKKS